MRGAPETPSRNAFRASVREARRALTSAAAFAGSVTASLVISGALALPVFSLRSRLGPPAPDLSGDAAVRRLLAGRWPAGWGTSVQTPAQHAGLLASLDLLRSYAGLAVAIACATVAALVLARAASRRREVAVRAALGAEPGRLARDAVLEATLLSLAALVLLSVVGGLVLRTLAVTRPDLLRGWLLVRPDLLALAVGAGAGVLALMLFSPLAVLPAASWRLARTIGAPHSTPPPIEGSLRHALAVAQLAASLSLLTGAGLLLKSGASRAPGGSAPMAPARTALWEATAPSDARARTGLYDALAGGAALPPGVVAAASSPGAWMGEGAEGQLIFTCPRCAIGGIGTPIKWALARHHVVAPGFFALLGTPPVRGRDLAAGDGRPGALVAVINRSFEAEFQGVVDPIGQWVRLDPTGEWYRIVGIVPDAPAPGVGSSLGVRPAVYLPLRRFPPSAGDVLVRGARADSAVVAAFARAGGLARPVYTLASARERLAAPLAWLARLTLAVAAVVLLLAIYGVGAVAVEEVRRRRRELAVRQALGAGPVRIGGAVIGRALRRVLAGAAWASGGAVLVTWLLQRVSPTMPRFDARVYGSALAVIGAVALVASVLALRAALRVEPREAMAEE